MGTFFRDGGWGMYPTAIFGFLLAATAVLMLVRPERRWALIATLSVVTLSSGLLGTCTGIINTMKYVAQTPEAEQFQLAAMGLAESTNNMVLALVLVIPSGLVAAVSAWRAAPASAPAASR